MTEANDKQLKDICLALMHADTEEAVIKILDDAGWWNNEAAWRLYGGYENNYNMVGNQQSRPDAALAEKLVNSIDARLLDECLVRQMDPEGPNAPKTISSAVGLFIAESPNANAGNIKEWSKNKRLEVSADITLAATGNKPKQGSGYPCFTIADRGEGQTPLKIPNTILSLTKSNKLRIPFVQGKFNMGGSGALVFCGEHNLQLVLSRRNPAIVGDVPENDSDYNWGFTVVRRINPDGHRKSSMYQYLSPLTGSGILNFKSASMPIFPGDNKAYGRESTYGTLIKLYEFKLTGDKSHILMGSGGLFQRLNLLLPYASLPIRVHECREYAGHSGSFETTLTGVAVQISDSKKQEPGFPSSAQLTVAGQTVSVSIHAFQNRITESGEEKSGAETYRRDEAVIFMINGQTHGYLTKDFLTRGKVGLSYLADSVLILVDCTNIEGRAREDLFMNSRDRLSQGTLRKEMERELEELLSRHQGLRELKESRRREQVKEHHDEDSALESVLESLFKRNPTLSNIFLKGERLSSPFKTEPAGEKNKAYKGERFPTYFKFKDHEYGEKLDKETNINYRCRVTFETNAENEYFDRGDDKGSFECFIVAGKKRKPVTNGVINLWNGVATLNLPLPDDCEVNDVLEFVTVVNDRTRPDPFENFFSVKVKPEAKPNPTTSAGRRKKPGAREEDGETREVPRGIQLPEMIEVKRADWDKHAFHKFDEYSALVIVDTGTQAGVDGAQGPVAYDFYLNMDNIYLDNELKHTKLDPKVVSTRFKLALTLVGLAMIQDHCQKPKKTVDDSENDEQEEDSQDDNDQLQRRVISFTKAIAPIILPMISELGTLKLEEEAVLQGIGEAT